LIVDAAAAALMPLMLLMPYMMLAPLSAGEMML